LSLHWHRLTGSFDTESENLDWIGGNHDWRGRTVGGSFRTAPTGRGETVDIGQYCREGLAQAGKSSSIISADTDANGVGWDAGMCTHSQTC